MPPSFLISNQEGELKQPSSWGFCILSQNHPSCHIWQYRLSSQTKLKNLKSEEGVIFTLTLPGPGPVPTLVSVYNEQFIERLSKWIFKNPSRSHCFLYFLYRSLMLQLIICFVMAAKRRTVHRYPHAHRHTVRVLELLSLSLSKEQEVWSYYKPRDVRHPGSFCYD